MEEDYNVDGDGDMCANQSLLKEAISGAVVFGDGAMLNEPIDNDTSMEIGIAAHKHHCTLSYEDPKPSTPYFKARVSFLSKMSAFAYFGSISVPKQVELVGK